MTLIEKIMAAASADKYGEDSAAIGKLAGLFMSARFEQGYAPFICGTIGERDGSGLHEGYIICPSYGADHRCSQVFRRLPHSLDATSPAPCSQEPCIAAPAKETSDAGSS